jgi:hypothetical protein
LACPARRIAQRIKDMLKFIIFVRIKRMNIADMPDEPYQPKRQKTALERAQEEYLRPIRQLEEMHRPLRQMEEMLRPLREWEEMQRPLRQWEEMQRQLAPARHLEEIEEQIRQASAGHQLKLLGQSTYGLQLREILDKSAFSKSVQDLLGGGTAVAQAQRMLEQYLPQKQPSLHVEALRATTGFNAMADAVNAIRPVTEHQEWFNSLQRHATGGLLSQDFARQIQQVNPTLTALAEAQRTLNSLEDSFRGIALTDFVFNEEAEQEAEQAAATITQTATAELTLQAAMTQIIAAIEAQQNPTVRVMLWLFFKEMMKMIIGGIIGAIISQHMPQSAPQSPPQSIKSIKEVTRATGHSLALLTDYRIVSAQSLTVRQNPKARSPKLGNLGFGKVVHILKKDKDFALVLWRDTDSGAEIQGWVFARYLAKFN